MVRPDGAASRRAAPGRVAALPHPPSASPPSTLKHALVLKKMGFCSLSLEPLSRVAQASRSNTVDIGFESPLTLLSGLEPSLALPS
eukprot:3162889-Prymnesium_polylepis.1